MRSSVHCSAKVLPVRASTVITKTTTVLFLSLFNWHRHRLETMSKNRISFVQNTT